MHELSLALSLLEAVAPRVPHKAALREVHVTVGPLAGVCAEALEFGFAEIALREGYLNAKLSIRSVPARFACQGCGADYESATAQAVCPHCGSLQRRLVSGAEFSLDSIELEE